MRTQGCKQGGGGVGGGWASPNFKLMLQAVTAKGCPKFRKHKRKKQLSCYKQCYTYIQKSKLRSVQIYKIIMCKKNPSILEAKPPTSQKLSTPLVYTQIFAHIAVSLQRQSLVPSPSATTHTLRLWRRSATKKGSRLWALTTTETTMPRMKYTEIVQLQ